MKVMMKAVVAVAMMLGVVMGSGCTSTPRPWRGNLVVNPDASLREGGRMPPVLVDVVAINETDETIRSYPVDNWFSGEDKARAGAAAYTKSITIEAGKEGSVKIANNDPIWEKWAARGYKDLVIFASSRTMKASPGGTDGRRKVIPLTNDKWDADTITFEVKASGVECSTAMRAVKQ